MPIKVLRQDLTQAELSAMPDTLYFNVDEGWFSVVWRASLRLEHKGLHSIRAVVVGDICPVWWEEVRRGGVGCDGCDAFHPDNLPAGCPHKEGFPAQKPCKQDESPVSDGASL